MATKRRKTPALRPVRNKKEDPDSLSAERIRKSEQKTDLQKRIKDTRKESEYLYHDLSHNFPALVCEFLPDSTLTYVNRAYCEYFGMTEEELIGRAFLDLIPEVAREGVKTQYLSLTPQNATKVYNHQVIRNGEIFWHEWHDRAFFDAQGKALKFQSIGFDITERKQAEKTLRESENMYRTLFNRSVEGIYLHDLEGRILDANQMACRQSGYTKDELLKRTVFDLHPDNTDRTGIVGQWKRWDPEQRFTFEATHRRKDGTPFPVEVSTGKIHYEDKEILLAIVRDITERKKISEALKSSEEKFRFLAEKMGDIVWTLDLNLKTTYVSPSVTKVLGFTPEERKAQAAEEIMTPESLAHVKEILTREILRETARDADPDRSINVEVAYYHKNGSTIWLENSIKALRDASGTLTGIYGVSRDISERKRAEEQIRKDLEEKTILLKEIHHRVKNNLTVISSLLNLQVKKIKTKQQAIEAFGESRDRVFAMALVHEKLYQSENFAHVDMHSYLNDMVRQLSSIYRISGNIRLRLEIENAVIDLNRAIPCALILNELITNAFKHAFPPDRSGEISMVFRPCGNEAYELIVSDDGIGLPAGFDPESSDSLGLHLIRLLTVQINGECTIGRDRGTSFRIRFPRNP
ncbi:MAG TPA: PAS domain S-box protein [bacterium]|nr:PAS domain S-box protein [bacterium]